MKKSDPPLERAKKVWGKEAQVVTNGEKAPASIQDPIELARKVLLEHQPTCTEDAFQGLLVRARQLRIDEILPFFNPEKLVGLTKPAQWDLLFALATVLVEQKIIETNH